MALRPHPRAASWHHLKYAWLLAEENERQQRRIDKALDDQRRRELIVLAVALTLVIGAAVSAFVLAVRA